MSKFNDIIVQRTVEVGMSFEAIDTTKGNKRIGVFLSAPCKKNTKSALDKELETMPIDDQMAKISEILDYVKTMTEPIIHTQHKVDEYLEGVIMSVLSGYGGQGVGKKLMAAVERMAKERKYKLIYVGCTSEFSARVVAKCGFQLAYSLRYDQYLKDGQPLFKPKAPHDTVRAYIKLLAWMSLIWRRWPWTLNLCFHFDSPSCNWYSPSCIGDQFEENQGSVSI